MAQADGETLPSGTGDPGPQRTSISGDLEVSGYLTAAEGLDLHPAPEDSRQTRAPEAVVIIDFGSQYSRPHCTARARVQRLLRDSSPRLHLGTGGTL